MAKRWRRGGGVKGVKKIYKRKGEARRKFVAKYPNRRVTELKENERTIKERLKKVKKGERRKVGRTQRWKEIVHK